MDCTKKTSHARSVASGDERRTDLLRQLGEQVEALTSSEAWVAWMDTAARFHSYSVRNQLLIATQRPDATRVAGYRVWQSLGRQVRRGERGIAILAPCAVKTGESDEGGEPERRLFFKLAYVFDVSQTDGDELPAMSWPVLTEGPQGLFDRLADVVVRLGLTLERTNDGRGTARGWYDPAAGHITIVDTYPAASQARTLLHELAHALDPRCSEAVSAVAADRSERELLAESVAYIVGKRLGIDSVDCSTFYAASWGADAKRLEQLAGEVLAVARELERAIGIADEVAA